MIGLTLWQFGYQEGVPNPYVKLARLLQISHNDQDKYRATCEISPFASIGEAVMAKIRGRIVGSLCAR